MRTQHAHPDTTAIQGQPFNHDVARSGHGRSGGREICPRVARAAALAAAAGVLSAAGRHAPMPPTLPGSPRPSARPEPRHEDRCRAAHRPRGDGECDTGPRSACRSGVAPAGIHVRCGRLHRARRRGQTRGNRRPAPVARDRRHTKRRRTGGSETQRHAIHAPPQRDPSGRRYRSGHAAGVWYGRAGCSCISSYVLGRPRKSDRGFVCPTGPLGSGEMIRRNQRAHTV